ncbi:DNA replication ATP-dependent helicase/nuclease DNA2-like isoform X2 [Centruroides sculpturatus]|uniref:DNA replication ATP-dependent helicase/nuclease DNA2-like isoform X2 n=1 Tax=Centruroides sculpturatus TaxID=218467 RepID=UPI000C6C9112|nr:DNA replication ATP-dependent helicase/nuclease DNA2-like isoform X2 [Centruroides sculpturatus]
MRKNIRQRKNKELKCLKITSFFHEKPKVLKENILDSIHGSCSGSNVGKENEVMSLSNPSVNINDSEELQTDTTNKHILRSKLLLKESLNTKSASISKNILGRHKLSEEENFTKLKRFKKFSNSINEFEYQDKNYVELTSENQVDKFNNDDDKSNAENVHPLRNDNDSLNSNVLASINAVEDVKVQEDRESVMEDECILSSWEKDIKDDIEIDRDEHFRILGIYHHKEVQKIDLLLTLEKKNVKRICSLEGVWMNTVCEVGDVVCVQAEFIEGRAKIDNENGLLIIHPDYLISSTTVSSALFCMRKTVLADKFQGWDSGNMSMLLGTIIHQLFQEVVQDDEISYESLNERLHSILTQRGNLNFLYENKTNETVIKQEAANYFPHIIKWKQENMNSCLTDEKEKRSEMTISSIVDIEDAIWCPRYGIRGKIDLTAEVNIHSKKKHIPIELKTGKSSFSFEHQAQVILYTMMMEYRNEDCNNGLLLYLKDGPQMRSIISSHDVRRDLIQLRNDLVHHIINSSNPRSFSSESSHILDGVPQPINKKRFCEKCPLLLPCTLNQRIFGGKLDTDHIMNELIPENTNHLSASHLNYFKHWYILLHLEKQSSKNSFGHQFWKQDVIEREQQGLCLSKMVLIPTLQRSDKWSTKKSYIHLFKRHSLNGHTSIMGLQESDCVIVSENESRELAVGTGEIININNNCVEILLDRDLYQRPTWTKETYRVDKRTFDSSTTIQLTNLLHLMDDADGSARLRKWLIDLQPPSFQQTFPLKDEESPIFKSLNKQQINAIEKILSSNDYILLKGMPGTGKTFTLVTLVRLLVEKGNSVLLTSHTHSALDNILMKLKEHDVDFVRLGRLSRIHPKVRSHAVEILTENIKTTKELEYFYNSKKVVGVTCLGINHPVFQHRCFDFCIVDEASQILQTVCLGPLFYANKFILIGDSQQLPPVVQNKEARLRGMSESLFLRLEMAENTIELNLQYRMNGEIMMLCNLLTYDGKLKCASADVENARLIIPKLSCLPDSIGWHKLLLSESTNSILFLNLDGLPAPESYDSQGLVQNEIEANIVTQISWTIIKGGILENDIGIITPYKKQVSLICNSLERHHLPTIEVNTVDQYQGRDKSVIIISCVRSSTGNKVAELLEDERRLNVAISRAKLKLIFVGSKSTLINYIPFKKLFMHLTNEQVKDACKSSISTFWDDVANF